MVGERAVVEQEKSGGEMDMKGELYKSFEDESNHEATLT